MFLQSVDLNDQEKAEINAYTDRLTFDLKKYLDDNLARCAEILSRRDPNFIQFRAFIDGLTDTWLYVHIPAEWRIWPIKKIRWLRLSMSRRFIRYFDWRLQTTAGLVRIARGVLPLAPPPSPASSRPPSPAPVQLSLEPFIQLLQDSVNE
ncbi:hypothetical protein V5O48_014924 [Marasmius crinis-equi]|uniref:Uncharacterized protein n=1 Tax=Marasmius crinis-equi TaxID=585013 RepID=A0ABR3EW97_9AGAR